jgi:glycerophosphoryl diester phosphodiesterase
MLIIGHRGASGTAPENTLASFEKAIGLGVKMIELDVHRCATGELVVIHDEKINRTTSGKGFVSGKMLDELKKVDAGDGEKIPTLCEVLNLVNRRVKINIELKGAAVAAPTVKLLNEYKENHDWKTDDFCISSFDHQQLKQFQELDNVTNIGILYERKPHGFAEMATVLHAFSVNISIHTVNPDLVKEIHDSGLEVWVYTVNKLHDFNWLESIGVDAVFTNYPEKFLNRKS